MMILAKQQLGELLAERDVAAIYRVRRPASSPQRPSGRAEGLGVACLRVDDVTAAALRRSPESVAAGRRLGGPPAPVCAHSDALLAALRAFEVTAARYDEHQRAMETYWGLRWLLQEGIQSIEAVVLRETWCASKVCRCYARAFHFSRPLLEPASAGLKAVDLLERSCRRLP